MRNSITAAYVSIGESFADDAIVAFVTVVTNAIQAVTQLIDTMGALPVILSATSPLILLLNRHLSNFVAEGFKAQTTTELLSQSSRKYSRATVEASRTNQHLTVSKAALTASINKNTASLSSSNIVKKQAVLHNTTLLTSTRALTVAKGLLAKAITGVKVALRGLLASTVVGAGLVAIGYGLEKLITNFAEAREETNKFEENLKEQQKSFSENSSRIKSLSGEYVELSSKTKLTQEESDRLLEVSNDLNELMPQFTSRIDEKGQSHLRSAEAIELEVKHLERLRQLENQETVAGFGDDIDSHIEDLKDYQKEYEKAQKTLAKYDDDGFVRSLKTLRGYSDEEIEREIIKLERDLESAEHKIKLVNLSVEESTRDNARARMELEEVTQKLTDSDLLLVDQYQSTKSEMIDMTEVAKGNLESLNNISDEVLDYAENLAVLRSELGNNFNLESLIELDINLSELAESKEMLEELKTVHNEVLEGGTDWEAYASKLEGVGFADASSLVQALKNEFKELQDQLALGLFEDIEGKIPITSVERLNMLNEEGIEIYRELNGQIIPYNDSLDDQADKVQELTSLHDQLLGSTRLNTEEVYNAIAAYDVLTMALQEAANNGEDLTHIENQLADTKEYLSSIFPHLVNGTELHIDAMAEEARQADILEHAIDLLAKGELSSQDARNLASAISTKARISHMQEEINALNRLATVHREIAKNIQDEIQRTGEGAYRLNHLLEHGSLPVTSNVSMFQNAVGNYYQSTIENLQSAIDLEIPSLSQATDALAKNTDYKERNTRATKDNEKATKDANKEKEKEIFLADKHKKVLDDLNREMSKQQNARNNLLRGSTRWQRAMKEEIRLTKEKREEIGRQIKELERLEQMGQVYQSGVVSASSVRASGGTYSGQYSDIINRAASQYGLDPNLIAAVIKAESNFNPNARSHAGARGLMQLMPATAASLGVKNSYDPEQNIMAGARYLSMQLKAFGGDIEKALAAYNAGAGNVKKWERNGQWGNIPFKETRNYVPKVLGYQRDFGGSVNAASAPASSNSLDALFSQARQFQNSGTFRYGQIGGNFNGTFDQFINRAVADCSQFVQEMFDEFLGIKLPRTAHLQANDSNMQNVSKSNLQAGDLVFFNTTGKQFSHVGIYKGDGKFTHMGSSGLQTEADLNSSYWSSRYTGARRHNQMGNIGNYAQHQQALFNQGQSIEDMQAEQHSLYLQQQKLQEEYFHGLIDNHERTIAHLERSIEEQQNIIDRLPEGHKDRDAALNQINYLNSLIDKQLNEIQYKAGQFSNSTKISEAGRHEFSVMRDEARLRREGVSLEQAERNADRVREKMTQLERLMDQQEGSIARLQREREKLVVGSNAYVASLDQESKHIAEHNRLLGRKQEEYEKAINSGKLTAKDMQEFRTALSDVNNELEIGVDRLAQLREAFIEAKMTQFDKRTQGIDRYVKRLSNELQYIDQGTENYTDRVDKQLAQLAYKQQTLHNQANFLRDQIASGMLTPAQVAEYEEMISDLGLAWWDVRHEIESVRQAQRDFIGSKLEEQKGQYIEGLQKAYEKLNKELEELIKKDEIFNTTEFLDNIDDLIYELDRIDERFINNALFRDSTYDLRNSLSQTRDEIISIANAVDLMTKKTSENKQELEQLIREQSAYANVIKNQIDALDKQIRDTQLNHKKIEDSLQNQIKLKQEQLQQLDKEEKQLDRNKRLQELLDEIEKVRNDKRFSYITEDGEEILTYDKGRLKELEKQRDELLEQYERDDIREAMQDEINEMQNKLDKTKNIHQQEIAELNLQKNALNTLYNGLVADTSDKLNQLQQLQNKHLEETGKQWDELIKEVQKGTKDFDALMETFYADTLLSLGEFGNDVQKQINEIVQAFRSLGNMQLSAPNVSGGSAGSSPSNGGNSSPTGIDQMKQNSQAWANTTNQAEKDRLAAENQQIGKNLGLSYNSGTGTWHTSDGLKAYHTGGIVGDSKPNKFTELMNKLLNTNANETVIKALNNELYSPQDNLAKFAAPNLQKLMGSIKPVSAQMLQPITENHYHLKDFTIKTDNAENFLSQIKHLTKSHKR
ncbi:transglycosylase SLT domain-containing protein [Alkalihalophilus pseudofirmus]|uniref:transglycosylase SLT domain-containing protein n=1 Tax=Alkalihalophilus pseudofirmus TaxID=79885 RepID=UPI00259BD0CD|nr:transglycosylase SLT domain-containing protein [Alkalihalophilus pseudofirmus]WEG18488.1 transglycosylase SLT domain-containing protein [Alkalihalophilus pseudofirmus]